MWVRSITQKTAKDGRETWKQKMQKKGERRERL